MKTLLALLSFVLAAACYASGIDDSSLIAAARSGDVAGIKQAVAHGANVNAPAGGNDWTPLLHAIHKNQIASVAALLDYGADANKRTPKSMTPLMMAAEYGYTDIVQLLLRRGANPALSDLDGATALDYAVTGTTDIDRFTLFSCQDDTVRALLAAAPQLRAQRLSLRVAQLKLKMCPMPSLAR
jgi:hypothetical protein